MSKSKNSRSCILCRSYSADTTKYGEVFDNGKWAVHHFCLLFTYCCEQNGQDEEGYQGFLMQDIIKAARQVQKNPCSGCRKLGANIKCYSTGCDRFYHTSCAWHLKCNFQFDGSFPVYCPNHNSIQFKEDKPLEAQCGICYDKLSKSKSILIPCCKNSWFHHNCLQKYANTSGYYYFKCPLCADRDTCIKKLPKMGIFMPIRDAQWELDDDFADMAQPPAVTCEFCDSSEGSEENHLWKMCDMCGHSGVHWICLEHTESQSFICRTCNEILEKKGMQEKPKTPRKQKPADDKKLPVLFLAPDEELCSDTDDESTFEHSKSTRPSTSTSTSESDKENETKHDHSNEMSDSTDEEVIKPKKIKKRIIVSDSDESDGEISLPRRKKMRVLSSPETPKSRYTHRL